MIIGSFFSMLAIFQGFAVVFAATIEIPKFSTGLPDPFKTSGWNNTTKTVTSLVSPSLTSLSSETSTTDKAYSGQGTFYDAGLSACGGTYKTSDSIVAISETLFDLLADGKDSNDNPVCGKKIRANYKGKSVEVTVVDSCVGCKKYDLDFTPSAFKELADPDLGRIDIDWEWLN